MSRPLSQDKFPNADFPGTQLDLDLLSAVARIRQLQEEGVETCSGLILDRLITCDMPRLFSHISDEATAWAKEIHP